MIFNNNYYATSPPEGHEHVHDNPLNELDVEGIAVSTPPMKGQLEGLKARIFAGANAVELGFSGAGKGSMAQGAPTPGSYGKDEREAMRELANINKVKLSTHATFSTSGFSGIQQGGFDESQRENQLIEIRRAIDFAADVAEGGAVVLHIDEFPREIANLYKDQFEMYPSEKEKGIKYLVDKETGTIVDSIRKDTKVVLPLWQKNKNGTYKFDEQENKMPVYNEKTRKFEMKEYQWGYFQKEAERINKDKGTNFSPEEILFREQLDRRRQQAAAYAAEYSHRIGGKEEELKGLEDKRVFFKKIESNLSDEEKQKLLADWSKAEGEGRLSETPWITTPSQYYEALVKSKRQRLNFERDYAISYQREADELEKRKDKIIPLKDYAVDKTVDSFARLGVYALDQQKKKGLSRDLFVSPENLFPERYGSHPKEMKELIQKSRQRMTEILITKGQSQVEAKKLAERHIKATFDVGHVNIWRKYYKGTDKEFDNWVVKEVKDLVEGGIIGHVHISDNFGYHDEHLPPGAGTAPIKQFIKQIKEAGIKEVVVEPAHHDYKAWFAGMREFGSSIYGAEAPFRGSRWGEVENSYFGKTSSPHYLVGKSRPSEDWTLWSNIPME